MQGDVLIETLELTYNQLIFEKISKLSYANRSPGINHQAAFLSQDGSAGGAEQAGGNSLIFDHAQRGDHKSLSGAGDGNLKEKHER